VPFQSLPLLALTLQPGEKLTSQPLPADEQLALLFHLAAKAAPSNPESLPGAAPCKIPIATPVAPSLAEAYQVCKAITRHHSKSFFLSTLFLPPAKRQATWALYAFCRATDDAVDLAQNDPACSLAEWVRLARAPTPPPDNPVLLAWHDLCTHYQLDSALVDEMLAGMAMDLTLNRYETFADLWLYCYRVASVVGLLTMAIIGTAPGAEAYAIKLGVAFQLTNILRDVGEDTKRNRVYLPAEDLTRFGLTAEDIMAGTKDARFQNLMRFEIERNQRFYQESWPGIALLPSDSRLAVGAASFFYRTILGKITTIDYDVFQQRAHLTLSEKLCLIPRIWWDVDRLKTQGIK